MNHSASPNTDAAKLRAKLKEDGFALIRGALSSDAVATYRQDLINHSKVEAVNFDKSKVYRLWTQPDGVTQRPALWPLAYEGKAIEALRTAFGSQLRFCQHTDTHAGFSAGRWHRDSVHRKYGVGAEWGPESANYQVFRVAYYLQSYEESGFRLGFIPGTHRHEPLAFRVQRKLKLYDHLDRFMTNGGVLYPRTTWVTPKPGDALIFDPRVLHRGSAIHGPKYSCFVAFGIENEHFHTHRCYYRHVRTDLGYTDPPVALVEKLKSHGLYPDSLPVIREIKDAVLPPRFFQTSPTSKA